MAEPTGPTGPTGLSGLSGDQLVAVLSQLANPHRLRVIAALSDERRYVSELARELGISRPLLQMHLRRLEQVGIVSSALEISVDGKALKYYAVEEFELVLTPQALREKATTLAATSTTPTARYTGDEEQ